MRIPFLPAVRWWREARRALPETRYVGQPVSERCRELQSEEVQWFSGFLERAAKRRD